MYSGSPVLARIMGHLPWHVSSRCVSRYGGDRYARAFGRADRYRCTAFARPTHRSGPRDIGTCPRARSGKPCRMGIRGGVSRNTPASADRARDWRIRAGFARRPIHVARDAHADGALPAALTPGIPHARPTPRRPAPARRRSRGRGSAGRGAPSGRARPPGPRGGVPAFIHASDGKPRDASVLDMPAPEAGLARLRHLHLRGGFPVPGAKPDTGLRRLSSRPVDRGAGPVRDRVARPDGASGATDCPDRTRRVRYRDPERDGTPAFLADSLAPQAMAAADIHPSRWRAEPFSGGSGGAFGRSRSSAPRRAP